MDCIIPYLSSTDKSLLPYADQPAQKIFIPILLLILPVAYKPVHMLHGANRYIGSQVHNRRLFYPIQIDISDIVISLSDTKHYMKLFSEKLLIFQLFKNLQSVIVIGKSHILADSLSGDNGFSDAVKPVLQHPIPAIDV